jgi:hypothetical protein
MQAYQFVDVLSEPFVVLFIEDILALSDLVAVH